MLELKVTLTASPSLEALLNRLCSALEPNAKKSEAPAPASVSAPRGPAAPPASAYRPGPMPVQNTPPMQYPTSTAYAPGTPQQSYPQPSPVQPGIPVGNAPAYTIDQLQIAVGALMDAGKGPQLQGLLQKYQVQRMPDLKPEQYGAFAADLRGLGAQI